MLPLADPRDKLRRVRAHAYQRSYARFIQWAWPIIEPGVPLTWNEHIQAVADHLQAVTAGRISRLLISMPPGAGKSTFTSVMWMPWQWIDKPWLRELYGSYEEALTYRDSMRAR